MPYFSIETNRAFDNEAQTAWVQNASSFIAELLGKPEQYVMTAVKPGAAMSFSGSAQPTAFIELKSIGLPTERCAELAEKISEFVKENLGISPDRVFIDFEDLKRDMFALNGETFA